MIQLLKSKNFHKVDVILVFHNTKASRKLFAVCSSKRAAISLVVNDLLKRNKIKSEEIKEYRETLNKKNQTQGLDANFELKETTLNKLF